MQRGNGHYYIESSFFKQTLNLLFCILESRAAGSIIVSVTRRPSGAAQGADYPAGTRGDIQVVTTWFKWLDMILKP